MPCGSCSGYVQSALRAHGFEPLRLGDHWPVDDGWPELDTMSLSELAEAHRGGLPLGQLTDIPTKWFLMAADIERDPLGPQTRRKFLRSARRIAGRDAGHPR